MAGYNHENRLTTGQTRIIVDSMLGKLCRWLRLYGYDSLYAKELGRDDDDYIIQKAVQEHRIIITRDENLCREAKKSGVPSICLRANTIQSQLLELRAHLHLPELRPENARCPMCNGRIEAVTKEEVRGNVPPKVLAHQKEFWQCTRCGQTYWKGSHWENIMRIAPKTFVGE
ncbi:MAG: hypothetical protein DRO11_02475 [Methanobacteriota archaeon]|nr:MAG: hypothetical protein DRO11_02475 [Euryarchaeota archaeon]